MGKFMAVFFFSYPIISIQTYFQTKVFFKKIFVIILPQLFRKDLISAMKLADTEILYEADYVVISDPWRQEWEKGVQVPVNQGEIKDLNIK